MMLGYCQQEFLIFLYKKQIFTDNKRERKVFFIFRGRHWKKLPE